MRRPGRVLLTVAGLIPALALGGCTAPKPPGGTELPTCGPGPAEVVASSLVSGDWGAVEFTGSPADAVKEYGIVTAGLGGRLPSTVTVGDITCDAGAGVETVALQQTYDAGTPWTFTTSATFSYGGRGWTLQWSPKIVYPSLDGYTRLTATADFPTRGQILAGDGTAIVYNRLVYKVGIDKTKVTADQALVSARMLATLLHIDPDAYVQRVANGGPKQFVIAQTIRAGQVPDAINGILGVLAQEARASLGPSPTFAIGVLGAAGEATAEDIEKSGGTVRVGETVGKTGLQASQNSVLRGKDGLTVYLAARADADVMPTPGATPTPSDSGTPGPVSTPTSRPSQILFTAPPVDGADLHTTLDVGLQTKAEKILAGQAEIASMVVLDAHTGALLAAANSPAAGANSYALTGRYAPGSTFKVSTSLALLRAGLTPNSKVDCPVSVVIDGKRFINVTGYPSSHNGNITLRQALAWSCNTAMINGTRNLGPDALASAAASLGLGVAVPLGVTSFMGSVPTTDVPVDKAAASFGQGTVIASPLAMATEAASVAAGHTVTPYLLMDDNGAPWQPPPPTGTPSPTGDPSAVPPRVVAPLTAGEDAALKDMMAAVISIGSGSGLRGLALGAKTGTAQFDQNGKTLTHAWMIAFNDKYTVAVFINVGASGASTAAPLMRAFFS